MESVGSKRMRRVARWAAPVMLLAVVAGCNQQKSGVRESGRGGHHGGLHAACADDIQKYCANEQRKRRCLKNNMEKLSDSCKAAVSQGRNRGGRSGNDADNSD